MHAAYEDPAQGNRIFLLTLVRLILAYRTKSMRYCLVTYRKPLTESAEVSAGPS